MITKTCIQSQFNVSSDRVKQIGNKQLFIVDCPQQGRVLVSYRTIVGKFINDTWHLTTQKYSVTTSKQLTMFARSTSFDVIWSDSI